jgi:uncharacterized metal-binding protein
LNLVTFQEVIEFSKRMNFQRMGTTDCYGIEKYSALISAALIIKLRNQNHNPLAA